MIERIRCKAVNCYLLAGSGDSILIDAGNSSDAARIYRRVKDKNVRLILLTHGHPDHAGAASELALRLRVPVAISQEDAELLHNPDTRRLRGHTVLGKMLALASKRTLRAGADIPLSPDIWMEDGDDLSEYGIDARIVALPGHTKGSVGILTDEGDFIVGDALFNIFQPAEAPLYEDRAQMEKSAESITQSGAGFLYVGHGKPFPIEKLIPSGDIPYRVGLL